jgi:hypothetical protein
VRRWIDGGMVQANDSQRDDACTFPACTPVKYASVWLLRRTARRKYSYVNMLALTSPTSGCLSVGIVRQRTQATEFLFFVCFYMLLAVPGHALLWLIPVKWKRKKRGSARFTYV